MQPTAAAAIGEPLRLMPSVGQTTGRTVLLCGAGGFLGRYFQVSNNFHGYLTTMGKAGEEWPWDSTDLQMNHDPYEAGTVLPVPMWDANFNLQEWDDDLTMFMEEPARVGIRSAFLRRVACPMVMAHRAYKKDGLGAAREILGQMPRSSDWRAGAEIWLSNREKK